MERPGRRLCDKQRGKRADPAGDAPKGLVVQREPNQRPRKEVAKHRERQPLDGERSAPQPRVALDADEAIDDRPTGHQWTHANGRIERNVGNEAQRRESCGVL